MKKHLTLLTSAACFFAFLTLAPAAPGQTTDPAAKLQMLSQQLKLTPQQKMQMLPILKDEGPKIEAIKKNTSLSGMQKMRQLRAIHPPAGDRASDREEARRRKILDSRVAPRQIRRVAQAGEADSVRTWAQSAAYLH